MKNLLRPLFVLLTLALVISVSPASAASAPVLSVAVANAAGKVIFTGKTNAKGLFTTEGLAPGNYVVVLRSKGATKGGPFALVMSAGDTQVVADNVPAAKLSGGGVAMKVPVKRVVKITGQVAPAGHAALTANITNPMRDNRRVKYINGKKFVWVEGTFGSNLGGRWVEAGSSAALNVQNVNNKDLGQLQDRNDINSGGHLGGN